MRDQRRVQKREIGRIGERALVKPEIVGKPAVRLDPEILSRLQFLAAEEPRKIHGAKFDRAFLFPVVAHFFRHIRKQARQQFLLRWQRFRRRHIRHGHLMLEARLTLVE